MALPNGEPEETGCDQIIKSLCLLPSIKIGYHLRRQDRRGTNRQNLIIIRYIIYKKIMALSDLNDSDLPERKSSAINILLVDDEKDVLYTFKQCLSSEGYNIEAFTDPKEGLAHFAKENPYHYDLAILDIRMPGLNGLQLYYRLKAINRDIKILFISALDAVPELTSILPGIKTTDDFIKKPVTSYDFVKTVKIASTR